MKVNKTQAELVLKKEAELATAGNVSAGWVELVESFSQICQGASKTHIAFLGTAMLAKAVSLEVDVFAVKAGAGGPWSLLSTRPRAWRPRPSRNWAGD